MQTQDAPTELIFKLWPWLEANKKRLIAAAAGAVLVGGIFFFISTQREQNEIAAGQALTQLLVAPVPGATAEQTAAAFVQVAEKYAGTAAGQRARLQAAIVWFDAGRAADAQAQFQKVYDADPTGPLAATAELGVAASCEAQGAAKLDFAATTYQKVVASFSGTASALTAEFGLGRVIEQQGRLAEALNHYENVMRAGQGGSLTSEAAARAEELKSKLAAVQKPAGKS